MSRFRPRATVSGDSAFRKGRHEFARIYPDSSGGIVSQIRLAWRRRLVLSERPDHDRTGGWVDNYVASYRYGSKWALLIFPIFGLLAIYLVRQSGIAVGVAIAADVLFILVFVQYKTYCIQLSAGSISTVSFLRSKSFALSDVDMIQHIYGGRGAQFLYLRYCGRTLLTVSRDLDGFDDLVGFLREYARHHQLIFATRDYFGEWTQAGGDSAPSDQP
jgi:hypothetical protein